MEKSDFCGRQFGVQKPQQKPVSPKRASPVQEHVRTYMLAGRREQLLVALQNHGNPAVCKTCRVPAETIETCTIFCPAAKILPTKRPPFWGPFLDPKTGAKLPGHKQIKLRLNEWTPFWCPFLDPKTGVVLLAKLLSPSEKKHKFRVSSCTRQKFPIPLGFQGFAAPGVLVLHTLRTFMSTHVLELGRPSIAMRGTASVPLRHRSGPLLQCAVPPRYRFGTARALYYNARCRHPVCVLQSFNSVGVMNFQANRKTNRNPQNATLTL